MTDSSSLSRDRENEEKTEEEEEEKEEIFQIDPLHYLKTLESQAGEGSTTYESDTCTLRVKIDKTSRPCRRLRHRPKSPKLTRHKGKSKPKPRVPIPTNLQKVFANKNVVKEHYFSSGSKVTKENVRDLQKERSPFKYPTDLEMFSYKALSKDWDTKQFRKELRMKYNERNSYISRLQTDLLNRLFVEDPIMKTMKTIVDYDPEYYNLVANRPINKPFRISNYIRNLRDNLRTKIVTGYRMDEIYLMQENLEIEEIVIEDINKEFDNYARSFEKFIKEDYDMAMEALRKAQNMENLSQQMYYEFIELSKKLSSITSVVYRLEERWRMLKLYQKCLYHASPHSWRKQYDFYLQEEEEEDEGNRTASRLFREFQLKSAHSLDNLIRKFDEGTKVHAEPVLYFKEPSQLLKVFRFMEVQNLNSLLHCEDLAVPLQNAKFHTENAKANYDKEIAELQELVVSVTGGILWEEERVETLEKLATELINGRFKKLISDESVLSLYTWVEDVYEQHVAKNDTNLRITTMLQGIEVKFRDYVLELDRLPQDIVHQLETNCYREEARIMRVATEASRKVLQIERMINNLSRLLEPVKLKLQKELKWRSPPLERPIKPPPPPVPLSEEEREKLLFFSNYCAGDDKEKEDEFLKEINENPDIPQS